MHLPLRSMLCGAMAPVLTAALAGAGDGVKLSGAMPLGTVGDVTDFALTPDGSRIVYRADQEHDEVFELYSAPVDGSTSPIRLHPTPPQGADVRSFAIGTDDRVVYAATQEGVPDIAGLFSVPADGSALPLLLHGPGIREFELAAGSFAVFTDDLERLFSLPIDGSTGALQLALDAADFETDPSSPFVLIARPFFSFVSFYSVPIDGSAPAVFIGTGWGRHDVRYAADGRHAYVARAYEALEYPYWFVDLNRVALDGSELRTLATVDDVFDQDLMTLAELPPSWTCGSSCIDPVVVSIDGVNLFAVDADGSDLRFLGPSTTTAVRFVEEGPRVVFDRRTAISAPPEYLSIAPLDDSEAPTSLVPPGHPIEFWELVGTQVVYSRPGSEPGEPTFRGLYSIAIDGGQAPLLLNGPPLPDDGVLGNALLSTSLQRAVFRSGTAVDEKLLSAPVDVGEPPLELARIALGGHVGAMALTPDGSRVVYIADQRADEVFELFVTRVDGTGEPVVLSGPLPANVEGDVVAFATEFDERGVVYSADQEVDGVMDLYHVAIDGRSPPLRLTAPLNGQGDVTEFVVGANTPHVVLGHEAPRAVNPSRLFGGRTVPPEGSLLDSTSQQILAPFVLAPDGSHVLYRKGASLDDCDLFSCPTDGSSSALPLGDFHAVREFRLAPAGDVVVFVARSTAQSRNRLYAASADGSAAPIQLDAPAPSFSSVKDFDVTPEGNRVVFVADHAVNGVFQLFSVPIDRSQAPVRLSLPAPFAVRDFVIGSSGQVVFREEVLGLFGPEPTEVHAVPAAGGTPPLRLTPGRRVESDYTLSPAGLFVFFRARAMGGDTTELYVTRTDGSWDQPLRVNGPLAAGRHVVSFRVTPDARQVVYLANERTEDVYELFRRSSVGQPVAIDALPVFADVTSFRIDARGRRVLYLADRDEDGREELYVAALDGSTPPERVNGDLVEGGDVRPDFVPLADGGVLYVADQELDETYELFHVPLPPPHLPAGEPARSASVVR